MNIGQFIEIQHFKMLLKMEEMIATTNWHKYRLQNFRRTICNEKFVKIDLTKWRQRMKEVDQGTEVDWFTAIKIKVIHGIYHNEWLKMDKNYFHQNIICFHFFVTIWDQSNFFIKHLIFIFQRDRIIFMTISKSV